MINRFDYIAYDDIARDKQSWFKEQFVALERAALAKLPQGRYQALFMTKLEEAYMYAGKAIRDDQVARGAEAPLQEERSPS